MKKNITNLTKAKLKSAFTLIEAAIVIVIIAILISGVVQSSKLVYKSGLNTAKSQTESSVVVSTKDLVAWFETTASKSFKDTETEDGEEISAWYDINPLSSQKFIALQSTSSNQPTYVASAINNLPSLKFDGANSYLEISYNFNLNPNKITIFAVVQTSLVSDYGAIISAQDNSTYSGYGLYSAANSPKDYEVWFGNGSSWNSSITPKATLTLEKPTIIASNNSGTTTALYKNGSLIGSATIGMIQNSSQSLKIGVSKNSSNTTQYFFNGYISELIIFKRVLTDEERQTIESYLSKKWGIVVDQ